MTRIILAVLGVWIGLAGSTFSQVGPDNPVVVELYTSQGCSSCPPADALLSRLAGRDDIIALALHVDYWDYIGWKDSFASPDYSNRQRAYARHAGARSVYTPQMIVGGMEHIVGARAGELDALVRQLSATAPRVNVALERRGGKVRIEAQSNAPLPGDAFVQLVRYRPQESVEIKRGENAGKVVDYANIVTEWRRLRDWDGKRRLSFDVDAKGNDVVVVIVQEKGPGMILGAARLR